MQIWRVKTNSCCVGSVSATFGKLSYFSHERIDVISIIVCWRVVVLISRVMVTAQSVSTYRDNLGADEELQVHYKQ
jgi:hypothetical protein